MIKRLTVAVAALFALSAQAFAAGTIPYSLSQQLDEFGHPLAGCLLYTIQAGTVSTPQNAYQDSALTIPLPNPIVCDASGRLPQFFLADGSIKVRLTKSTGVNVVTADGILVVGASSGGGGGSPVDPTTIMATGDIKVRYGIGTLTGFVRMNGRTIGSATSGATERANADTQTLFEYFWNNDSNLTVSGGRGASSIADWTANKTLTLPDLRGRMIGALEDMGNISAGRLLACANSTTLGTGCAITSDQRTLQISNLPSYTLPDSLGVSSTLGISDTQAISNTLGLNDPGHVHSVTGGTFGGTAAGALGAGAISAPINGAAAISISSHTTGMTLTGGVSLTGTVSLTGGVSKTGSVTSGGIGQAFNVLPPAMLFTVYVKL